MFSGCLFSCVRAYVHVRARVSRCSGEGNIRPACRRLQVFFLFFECLQQLGEGTVFTDVCPFVCLLA